MPSRCAKYHGSHQPGGSHLQLILANKLVDADDRPGAGFDFPLNLVGIAGDFPLLIAFFESGYRAAHLLDIVDDSLDFFLLLCRVADG